MPNSVDGSIMSEMGGNENQTAAERTASYIQQSLSTRREQMQSASYDQKQSNQEIMKGLNTQMKDASAKDFALMLKEIKEIKQQATKSFQERREAIKSDDKYSKEERENMLKQIDQEEEGNKALLGKMERHISVSGVANQLLQSIGSAMTENFKEVISNNNANRNTINTRLQGIQSQQGIWYNQADKWSQLQRDITTRFGMSMIVNEKSILSNIRRAVDQGIASNVEQRALLATLAENIATTFDAFSAELTRFIRIQQQDNTTLMLGMESSLTTMLNSWFEDTSYLNNNRTASVSGQLMEAMSQMDAMTASEFNFTVQKWLGSLYSLGMSDSAISALASAIGQIYSGDVTGVNESMQNLFAMSAARSGQSYADILTQGIYGSDVNSLMQSMVEYLAEIADDTNNVVRTAHGSVFGMSVSDLKAASNLMGNIGAVAGQSTSVGTMLGQTANMIGTIGERLGTSGMLNNLLQNFKYTTAANIVGSGFGQAMYEIITDMGSMIDTAIPFISAAGFGVDLEAKVSDIIKAGLGGISIISGIGTLISGLSNGAAFTNLDESLWNTTGLTVGGTGYSGITSGAGRSQRATGGGGGSDISTMEVTEAKSSALSSQGYDEGATKAPEKNTDDIYYEIENLHTDIKALMEEIRNNLFGNAGPRKPILVDINSLPGGILSEEIGGQSVRVNVTNGDTERIPVEMGSNLWDNLKSAVGIGG